MVAAAAAGGGGTTTPPGGGSRATPSQTVICLGDSHTHGFWGSCWVRTLQQQLPHLRFINAGVDGQPTASIMRRLPGLLRAHPNPAAVTILAGSNDVIAQQSRQLQRFYAFTHGAREPCSEAQALDNVAQMVQLVRQQAPGAKVRAVGWCMQCVCVCVSFGSTCEWDAVGCCTLRHISAPGTCIPPPPKNARCPTNMHQVLVINLPIMVEDPTHPANRMGLQYSTALSQRIAAAFGPAGSSSVHVLDFQAACRQHMAQHSAAWSAALAEQQQQQQQQQRVNNATPPAAAAAAAAPGAVQDGSSSSSAFTMSLASLAYGMVWATYLQRLLLRRSWDDVSRMQRLLLLTDQVHINDTAAGLLLALLLPHLQQL
jgi:hypothetical protein